jgi:hypothetical protein
MFSLLIAAAIAATPTPATEFDLGRDAPIVCQLRFDDQLRLQAAGVDRPSHVIAEYARLAKLNLYQTALLTSLCNMFDAGATHGVNTVVREQAAVAAATGEPKGPSAAK